MQFQHHFVECFSSLRSINHLIGRKVCWKGRIRIAILPATMGKTEVKGHCRAHSFRGTHSQAPFPLTKCPLILKVLSCSIYGLDFINGTKSTVKAMWITAWPKSTPRPRGEMKFHSPSFQALKATQAQLSSSSSNSISPRDSQLWVDMALCVPLRRSTEFERALTCIDQINVCNYVYTLNLFNLIVTCNAIPCNGTYLTCTYITLHACCPWP